ncbi:MAG: FecR domain-containing protein, partial [Fibrobacterota bacterium]
MVLLSRIKAIVLLTSLILLAGVATAEQMIDRGAKVNFYVGKVMIKHANEKEWLDAKIGMKLKSADAVRTYVESKCDIETPEGTVINIQENTVFELSEVFQNARTKANDTKVNIKTGSVWANVKKLTNKRSSFVFETPTATAAIRGTELGIDVGEGKTRVHVKEGSVEVQSRSGGRPVFVFENQQAYVEKGKDGVDVQPEKGDSGSGGNDLPFELNSPKEGQEIAGLIVPLSGKTAPGATIKVVGGTDLIAAADGSFNGSITLPEGLTGETVIAMAAIFQGKTSTKTVKLKLKQSDATPAKEVMVAIVEPAEGASYTSNLVPCIGTATPGAQLTFGDGQQITAGPDGVFNVKYKLPGTAVGAYDVKVSAALAGAVKSASVNVKIVEVMKELAIVLNAPSPGEEFIKTNKIPVEGITLPGAKVTFGSGAALVADATGAFRGIYEVAKKFGEHELAFTVTAGSVTKKLAVKIKVVADAAGCLAEVLDPSNGADVPPDFTVNGKVDNPDNNAIVYVNGVPATVTGNAFTALVSSGFRMDQGGQLLLSVTEPRAGAKYVKLPIMVRGKVTPATAKVLIDGTKEARVSSDGSFEAEYPMSDETGDYDVEVIALLESGQEIKKKFDVNVQTECNGVRAVPVKVTYNIELGMGKTSGEQKQSVNFRYDKQKYELVLLAGTPVCANGRVAIDVKTNAAELRANDKIIPLSGAGGTLRSARYDIDFSDRSCFPENEVTFTATDESANPPSKEQVVSWSCPILNLEKPELTLTDLNNCLSIRVNDKSFLCDKAEENIRITVEATGKGQIFDLDVSKNGESPCVPFEDGVNILYTVKALDKGKNVTTQT